MDPKCSVGSVVDADREESFSFNVELEVGEGHEVLGGVYFEPVVVNPALEPMEEEVADLMDIEDSLRQQDPVMETVSKEDKSSENDPKASGSNPDWIT